jgi:hypothetical protein
VKVFWEKAIVVGGGGGKLLLRVVGEQEAGGQQAQVGRFSFWFGVRGVPRRSKGRVRGLRRSWKALLLEC